MRNIVCRKITLLVVITLALISCPSNPGPSPHFLTGTVRDIINGTLLQGVTVSFGDMTTTTDANGRFSISLGTSGTPITADFSIYKNNYQGFFMDDMVADSSKDIDIIRSLFAYDYFSYPTKILQGDIKYSDGTELTDGTKYEIKISAKMPAYGESGSEKLSGIYALGYSVLTHFQAADCDVVVSLLDGSDQKIRVTAATNIDLSGAGPISIDFTFPLTENLISDVTVDCDQIGDIGGCLNDALELNLVNPFRSGTTYANYLLFSGPTSQTVDLLSLFPAASIFWLQMRTESPSYARITVSCSGVGNLPASSSTVSLPTIVYDIPPAIPDYNSITYDHITGILTIPSVLNTNVYSFEISCDEDGAGPLPYYLYATINSPTNIAILPQWLRDRVTGKTVHITVRLSFYSDYFNIENCKYPTFMPYGAAVPNLSGTEMWSGAYIKEVIVP